MAALGMLHLRKPPGRSRPRPGGRGAPAAGTPQGGAGQARQAVDAETRRVAGGMERNPGALQREELVYTVRGREIAAAHLAIAALANPQDRSAAVRDPAEIYRWMREENAPGRFPFTAGVFPLKRWTRTHRMFAGEATRAHNAVSALVGQLRAKRLSTAFDSVTLYGFDPDVRPDIYASGHLGVRSAPDDVKCSTAALSVWPNTSVSMTINGPRRSCCDVSQHRHRPAVDRFQAEQGGPGPETTEKIRSMALSNVRARCRPTSSRRPGQNTCIFASILP